MPDKRKHRGRHPDDERLFAESQHGTLRTAVVDYAWLLTRDYAEGAALVLVGNRFNLTTRQRLAVRRSSCSDESLRQRAGNLVPLERCQDGTLGIDGYNLLITIESALSGGLVLIGQDGCYRDLASVHGTYRKVEETAPSVELIAQHLHTVGIAEIDWYLDRPVSNSGRLKAFMAEVLERMCGMPAGTSWNIELVASPDRILIDYAGPVATADSAILDARSTGRWVSLAREIIDAHIPGAWFVDLRPNR